MLPMPTKFHFGGRRRESDKVWRIPRRSGGETYLLLLMEFQSTLDPWMALRVLVYTGLVWQEVVKSKQLPPDGKLPPVLPVVLYNGRQRWEKLESVRDLIGLPDGSPLWPWQTDGRYYLIDEGAFAAPDLALREGLPALLFRLEGSPELPEVVAVIDGLLAWFGAHPGFLEARSVFVTLLRALAAPLDPEVRIPEDLLELRNMLATRGEEWKQQWRQEGRQEGRQQGRQEGRREGLQQGEAALLLRQLERRFGPLPEAVRERVVGADTEILEVWADRVLESGTLAEVLK